MSKPTKSKKVSKEKARQYTPEAVYLWIVGLGLTGYLVVGEFVLGSRPHPFHWMAGPVGGMLGYFIGWRWYRWRGDVL